jgi:TonB family protein
MPTAYFGRRMLAGLLGVAIVAGGWSHAPTLHAHSSASVQIPTTPVSFASPELDALAAKLALEIKKRHFPTVAVFGALGPGEELTVLGPAIGEALSGALSRQAQDFQVIERSALRDRLKQERLSDSMLLVGNLANWVSRLMKVRAVVFVTFGYSESSSVIIKAGLYDASHHDDVSRVTVSASFVLDASQEDAVRKHLYKYATLREELDRSRGWPDKTNDGQYSAEAKCAYCPHPEFTERAREAHAQGVVWLNVTITSEGKADDISVVRTAGFGFDEQSVITIRDWKFKPARDKDGNAVSERLPIEITFSIPDIQWRVVH